jgi:hypothetical protein
MVRTIGPFALFALIVSLAPQARAQDAAGDQAFFDAQTSKFVKLQPERMTSEALGKVFNAIIYHVKVVGSDGGYTNAVVARTGDDITIISIPTSTADMPDLVKLFKADFTLKSDADSHLAQDALDVLYPIDATSTDDMNAKAIRHTGNQWIFIRGKFFDHFKGFIFTTDDSGKVTAAKWTLDDIK